MSPPPLRILHAIHDFLPRHRAGSELYAAALCRELRRSHEVTLLAAEYDPSRRHGTVERRVVEGLPVFELVNNWVFSSFAESYASPELARALERVLDETAPDVVHVHSLLNLSFELPRLARAHGAAVVATVHDYTLFCPSGGQRLHRAEQHVCREIEPERCARCFRQSPFYAQMAFGRVALAGPTARSLGRLARWVRRAVPRSADTMSAALRRTGDPPVAPADIDFRLDAARAVLRDFDRIVSPSRALADELLRLGAPPERLEVRDYGFAPLSRVAAPGSKATLRIGYVGSIVWHKGVHVLLDALRRLPPTGWSLTVHGDPAIDPAYSASLRESASGMPVRFAGVFAESEAAARYADLDLLVVPSLWLENSPLVIHEAFQAGVPVVGARIGGIPDLVRDGIDGRLFAPGSVAELAEILVEALERREQVRAWSAELPVVRTIAQDAREWESSYRELLSAQAAVRADP